MNVGMYVYVYVYVILTTPSLFFQDNLRKLWVNVYDNINVDVDVYVDVSYM